MHSPHLTTFHRSDHTIFTTTLRGIFIVIYEETGEWGRICWLTKAVYKKIQRDLSNGLIFIRIKFNLEKYLSPAFGPETTLQI